MVRWKWSTSVALGALLATSLSVPSADADQPSRPPVGQGFSADGQQWLDHPGIDNSGHLRTSQSSADTTSLVGESSPLKGVSAAKLREERGPTGGSVPYRWASAGFSGQGVKVGVIDYFDPALLASEIATGELPNIPAGQRKCFDRGAECPFGGPGNTHGNAITEIIADLAPDAQFYLAEVGTIPDYYLAINWFAVNGVTVVNHSLQGVYDGPGDGTGAADAAVDYAVGKGMAFITTAGDAAPDSRYTSYKGGYWRGTWNDPNNNGWLNFSGTDETLGTYCGALMGLRWNDWGAARTDYELWVGDYRISTKYNATAVLASDANQVAGAAPLEGNDFRWLCNTNPANGPVYDTNRDGFVALKVRRSKRSTPASSVGDVLELHVLGGWFEYSTAEGSADVAFADSKNPGAAAVGTTMAASGRGPTSDGRIVPSLVDASCSNTLAYGQCDLSNPNYFLSSEVATARVTGWAALAQSALGPMTPEQTVQYLKSNASSSSIDGSVTPNNTLGFGIVDVSGSSPVLPVHTNMAYLAGSGRIADTRVATPGRPTTLPLAPGATLKVKIPGLAYLPSATLPVAILNVTVVQPTAAPSWVQAFPPVAGVPFATSNLNVQQVGQNVANLVVVPVSSDGYVSIYDRAGGHLVVDYLGGFADINPDNASLSPGASKFIGTDPNRVYTSRCVGCTPLAAGTSRDVKVTGFGDNADGKTAIPDGIIGASAVVSVTADQPSAAGFISAVATTVNPPMPTSTANFRAGRTVSGLSIVPIDANGKIRIFSSVSTNVHVDVLGYFSEGSYSGGWYHPVTPMRVLNTRTGTLPLADVPNDVDLTSAGVPPTAASIWGNLTTTASTGTGVLRIGRNASVVGGTFANVDVDAPGQVASTSVASRVENQHVSVTSTVAAHRILDVYGWFSAVPVGTTGQLEAFPYDPANPPTGAGAPAMSGDGHLVAYWEEHHSVGKVRLWNRTTGVVDTIDVTPGDNDPLALDFLAISNDGQRLVFSTSDTSFRVGAVQGATDVYEFDRSTSNLHYLGNRAAAGPGVGVIRVDSEVTKFWFSTADSYDPSDTDIFYDLYERSLTTDAVSLVYLTDNWAPYVRWADASLDTAIIDYHLWTRAGGAQSATLSAGIMSVNDDGSKAIYITYPGVSNVALYDLATGTSTVLCPLGASGVPNFPNNDGIDWSYGSPPIGTWCTAKTYGALNIITGNGVNIASATYNGLQQMGSVDDVITGHGVTMFRTSGELVPHINLVHWLYLHHNV